jgi:hypothetical protein
MYRTIYIIFLLASLVSWTWQWQLGVMKRREISWTAAQGDFCSMLSQYSSLHCPSNFGNQYYVIIYSTVVWEYICKLRNVTACFKVCTVVVCWRTLGLLFMVLNRKSEFAFFICWCRRTDDGMIFYPMNYFRFAQLVYETTYMLRVR